MRAARPMLSGWLLDPAGNGGARGMITPCASSGVQGTEPGLCPAPGPFFLTITIHWLLMYKTCAIVPAAGSGIRMGSVKPKQFLHLAGKPLLAYTLSALSDSALISNIILVVAGEQIPAAGEIVSEWADGQASGAPEVSIVAGGAKRRESVHNGLIELPADCGWVMVHDGVRPFASVGLIRRVWEGALATGACVAAIPSVDTVKRGRDAVVQETLPRDESGLYKRRRFSKSRSSWLPTRKQLRRDGMGPTMLPWSREWAASYPSLWANVRT